jgi:four helix bundle protein
MERCYSKRSRQNLRRNETNGQNLSEGSGSRGGNRTVRYRSALGSVQETAACIDVALALGYIESVDAEIQRSLEAVRRVLIAVVV